MRKYLFILSPPLSGSTILWRLLATSPNVSALLKEGQNLSSTAPLMAEGRWDRARQYPWARIKHEWEKIWDLDRPILLEKSPPNLLRAFEIERVFSPAHFVIFIRNPYAFCAGQRRGRNMAVEDAARFWAELAQAQIENAKGLTSAIHLTYETFTDTPDRAVAQLLDFVPELERLDTEATFDTLSILGPGTRGITNLNQLQIGQLSPKDIAKINTVLQDFPGCMDFFGYTYISLTKRHLLRHHRATFKVMMIRVWERVKSIYSRKSSRI